MSSSKRKANEISQDDGWSVGPSDNFSDWVIEVVDKESGKTTPYHVHRKDLARGAHKSEYFVGVFRSEGLRESNESVTRLELESRVAKAFVIMLSYLYTGKLDCRSKHIVPLFWLADYFMIESMQAPLKELRVQSLKSKNFKKIITIYKDAESLGHEETLCTTVHYMVCATLRFEDLVLEAVSPEFFLRMLEYDASGRLIRQPSIIHKYISFHSKEIDSDMFCNLVEKAHPPGRSVQISHATKLLEFAKEFPGLDGLTADLLKRTFDPVIEACRKKSSVETNDTVALIGDTLNFVKKMPCVDSEIKSTFQDSLVHYFTNHPEFLEDASEDWLMRLYEFLPQEGYLKLFAALQTKCRTRKEENIKQKEEHDKEVQEYMYEFSKCQRFC